MVQVQWEKQSGKSQSGLWKKNREEYSCFTIGCDWNDKNGWRNCCRQLIHIYFLTGAVGFSVKFWLSCPLGHGLNGISVDTSFPILQFLALFPV